MKIAVKIFSVFTILIILSIIKLNFGAKTALAALTDPSACDLDHVTVDSTSYTGDVSNPIPEFKSFTLVIACVSSDPAHRGSITASLFATVNRQTRSSYSWTDLGASGATISLGPYDGMPGDLGPLYAQYQITTKYASLSTGGGQQAVNCSTCTLYVSGTGVRPPPTPPGGSNCPSFRALNPDPPIVNQSFQLQYDVPSSPNPSLTYQFNWTKKDGTKGITPLDKTTAPAYGVWVGTFRFNQETVITLGFLGYQGATIIPCDTHTVFTGVAAPTPGTRGLPVGKNPCESGTCETAIGAIPTNLGNFASTVLRIALGISGGIVLILMVVGSIRVMTSSGDPQRVAAGRDMIVAALAGALFIAFSVMIMQFLGTAVVPIPGLTYGT